MSVIAISLRARCDSGFLTGASITSGRLPSFPFDQSLDTVADFVTEFPNSLECFSFRIFDRPIIADRAGHV
jgi:hypothetical protein